MKLLVVGAGATYAQSIELGCNAEMRPPLMRDFARKTWANFNPHPLLDAYLDELGLNDGRDDLRERFYELEETGQVNIERFMEFAWQNKDAKLPIRDPLPPGFIYGARIRFQSPTSISVGGGDEITFWENFLYHGIGNPLVYYLTSFFENGVGWRSLDLTKSVAAKLDAKDFVLNLNYDTVFEIALEQLSKPFAYAPNTPDAQELVVCKPHGSLNMVSDRHKFTFGQPTWFGTPETPGFQSFSGLIPPRLNKRYDQHPMARIILDSARHRHPKTFVMWGVGLTESDTDLLALYSNWAKRAGCVQIINPAREVADKASTLLRCKVAHFDSVTDWLASN